MILYQDIKGACGMADRLKEIRESEKKSHIEMYSNERLYKPGSWLGKPIKTVQDIMPLFSEYKKLRVLDLGCGVGRNCLTIARKYSGIECQIDCVDILELAIEKLYENAEVQGVASAICGIVAPIEDFVIQENEYDLIMAVSALEHVDTRESFVKKLREIRDGIRENGVVCLVMNSDVREYDKVTGNPVSAQFEVNLGTGELQNLLKEVFLGWHVIKATISEQQYDIPRAFGTSDLRTKVVTYVGRKKE